jgi:hypothetical protein
MIQADSNTLYRFNNENLHQSPAVDDTFFMELGQYHIVSFVQSTQNDLIKWFEFKNYTEPVTPEMVTGYIARLPFDASLSHKSFVIHNNRDAVLMPSEHHVEHLDQTLLSTISGDLFERIVKNEDVFQWEITNVFGIESYLFDALQLALPNASHLHSNSIYLKSIFRQLSDMHDQWMKIYFYPYSFTVLVIKDEKLQLLQSYYYETSEDVIYQLLNITEQLHLDVTSVFIQVSGLIEADSTMYAEMRKNFLEISLEEASVNLNDDRSPIPSHYFTPIFLSPLCV